MIAHIHIALNKNHVASLAAAGLRNDLRNRVGRDLTRLTASLSTGNTYTEELLKLARIDDELTQGCSVGWMWSRQ